MKPIPNYEGLYSITEDGKVWSHRRKRFLKPYAAKDGYPMVALSKNNKQLQAYIHRLVAITYIPNPHGYTDVNHKDEVKSHNWVDNLEWCSRSYNINYGTANTRRGAVISEKNSKPVYCVELDKTFPSETAVFQELKIHVNNVLRGNAKTAGGYHWQYAKDVL